MRKREIVLHAQEQAMIVRDLGDAVRGGARGESKHHGKREALLDRNFGCIVQGKNE